MAAPSRTLRTRACSAGELPLSFQQDLATAMNHFRHFRDQILEQLSHIEALEGSAFERVVVELPRDPKHGDLACNAAMVLAKAAGLKPRDLAETIKSHVETIPGIASVEIAGPGFLNLRLGSDFWLGQIQRILEQGTEFGSSDLAEGEKLNVEYVSANPTGPLHLAHARGAVIGDVMARLSEKVGFDVTREYYINDAGGQVDTLARSAYLRYREAFGEAVTIPEGLYPGDYLVAVGQGLKARDGDTWLAAEEADWLPAVRDYALAEMLKLIKTDLKVMGIEQHFTSEAALVAADKVSEAVAALSDMGLMYRGVLEPPKGQKPEDWEPREQLLFRSSDFGDDVDRPIQKSDGSWTYFANDIAYHYDKYQRGFAKMINVFGVDHAGYVKRLRASVKAMTQGAGDLTVLTCNLVKLYRDGELVKMSKRSGNFITLGDVLEEIGSNVLRFVILTRRSDMPLDIDYARVLEASKDNPVWAINYAYARINSVFRKAEEMFPGQDLSASGLMEAAIERLTSDEELAVMNLLSQWPQTLETAAFNAEPHRIAFYLQELASAFNSLWSAGHGDVTLRFLQDDDAELSVARLALLRATSNIILSGFDVMGVVPQEVM